MRENEVPSKTDAGRDEIQNRTRKLPMGLRSILLMVDGQRSVRELRGATVGLRGAEDALEQLREMGLIAVPMSLAAAAAATIPVSAASVSVASVSSASVPAAANDAAKPADTAGSGFADAYAMLSAKMSQAVREHLGMRGYFLQLKIDDCSEVAELLALLPELSSALGHVRDLGFANDVERRLREVAQA